MTISQWNSFVEDISFKPVTLPEVIKDLNALLMPHTAAARALEDENTPR